MRENHYTISCINLKISYVFTYKINITLLLNLLCLGKSCPYPNAKLVVLLMFCIIEDRIIT